MQANGDINNLSHVDINNMSLSDLQLMKGAIQAKVNAFPLDHISQFVHYTPSFISVELSEELQRNLWDRILNSNSKPRKSVRYLWVTHTLSRYRFSGHDLPPTPFQTDDPLLIVLAKVNMTLPRHLWLDSILLAFYENGEIGVGFHDDNEPDIDQRYPIKNVSLSSDTRDILFQPQTLEYTGEASFTLENGSMLTMEPGTQMGFKHSVPAQLLKGNRINLSCRKAITCIQPVSVPPVLMKIHHTRRNSMRLPAPPQQPSEHPHEVPLSTLTLGTSVTRPLDLGPNCINLSKGGETLQDLVTVIKEHHKADQRTPDNIIVHGGTKDLLRRTTKSAQMLKEPLTELLSTVKSLYPSSNIIFMSLLPIDPQRQGWRKDSCNIVINKVLAFNRLARWLCKSLGVYHIHTLKAFLNPDQSSVNAKLFRDHIHPNIEGICILKAQIEPHLARLKPLKKPLPTPPPCTPINLTTATPEIPLDDTPPNLTLSDDNSEVFTSSPKAPDHPALNQSSEVEINVDANTPSAPSPAASTTNSSNSKSYTQSIMEMVGFSSSSDPVQPS